MLFAFLFFTLSLYGQEKKNTITIGGIAAHYINNEKYQLIGPFNGYYKFPVDPGFELLYLRPLWENLKVGTGFNFQQGRVASYMSGLRRFQFTEVSIPLILQGTTEINQKNSFFITSGIYTGAIPRIKAESPDKGENWNEYADFDMLEKSSDDIWFVDIYFDAGYSRSVAKNGNISIAPFVKYRSNSTWLNYHQKKAQFGFKLIYSLKF